MGLRKGSVNKPRPKNQKKVLVHGIETPKEFQTLAP
jgi:hypothetical protein